MYLPTVGPLKHQGRRKRLQKPNIAFDAAIAQWIRLLLPSCHSRFESQAHGQRSYQFKI